MPKRTAKSNRERERKFLVKQLPADLARYPHQLIEQGYLAIASSDGDGSEVRVRHAGKQWVMTVKKGNGHNRAEVEFAISISNAKRLWPLTQGRRVKKVRYKIAQCRLTIELDVYRGNARGLAVAEVEFPTAESSRRFQAPAWFGREVTGSRTYSNAQIARKGWKRNRR